MCFCGIIFSDGRGLLERFQPETFLHGAGFVCKMSMSRTSCVGWRNEVVVRARVEELWIVGSLSTVTLFDGVFVYAGFLDV